MNVEKTAAIVGVGLIGSAWSVAFARAGWRVQMYDERAAACEAYGAWADATWDAMVAHKLVTAADARAARQRVTLCSTLPDALDGACYVQESAAETVEVKTSLFSQLDGLIGKDTIIGSSSSGIPGSAFTEECKHRGRMLICHPVNPPHLIPLVELVPTPWTDPEVVEKARGIMTAIGQTPILVRKEIGGFVLNRLQGALLNEAWALYEDGVASLDDIDATVRDGLGLRWEFMGPFETIDLNAPGGISDYASRFRRMYSEMNNGRKKGPWPDDVIKRADEDRAALLSRSQLKPRSEWRDGYLMDLVAFRKGMKRD
ncbi:3-hydroxyacyl-CoA dehydrogenase [Castellaniella caeni]